MNLPPEMLATANKEPPSTEEGWSIADFPRAIDVATKHSLACIGGQFQFRGPIGIAEMYWLNADSSSRKEEEDWDAYVKRANAEVLAGFNAIVEKTDFMHEARGWKHIAEAIASGRVSDPTKHLLFVAYFHGGQEQPNQRVESNAGYARRNPGGPLST